MARTYSVFLKYQINVLARHFYKMSGYTVKVGYDFSKTKNPRAKLMWHMAIASFEYWEK